jgi:putative ABC transport system ATP-binding protein
MNSPFLEQENKKENETIVKSIDINIERQPRETESNTKENSEETMEREINPNGSLVKIKDLKVVYNPGKTNEARALSGVSIEIYPEEYVTFFGPSGCGKSTLLNVIAGLEAPSEGEVMVAGQDLIHLSSKQMAKFHRKSMGMVFQAYNLIPTLNVLDNIILPQIFERVRGKNRKERGNALLERLGITDFGKRLPQELSGGQQQRVGIARALVNNPAILLADEAVGNLDSESAKNVLEILSKLNTEEKKTVIAVTHNPEHLFYADRIFYMKDGMIIKTEVNREKRKPELIKKEVEEKEEEKKKGRTSLDLLLQAYPDLSGMQLHTMLAPFKAKVLANYLISQFEFDEIQKLEAIITERLLDRIDKNGLLKRLDNPADEGGLGLNKSTAIHFSEVIEEVVGKADFLKNEYSLIEQGEPDPIELTVSKLRKSLLDDCTGHFTLGQIEAINKGIEYRLLNKISRDEFREFLDRSFADGGAGLNRKTAKNFAKKLEIIILAEYGKNEKLQDKNL